MHVLVTGGAGFIGSHIVDGYVARGWDVTVVDDLSTGERSNVNPKARLVVGSVTDPAVVAEVVRPGVDLLNHHAAQMDVRRSVADPVFDAEQNIVASLRLLEQVVKSGVGSVIFASSGGAAYGEPVFVPQTENHPFAPMSPYGCAKLSVEHYLGFYRQVHGIRAVALRYGNVYGPRQKKHGEAGVVAIFAGKMLAGETVTINGSGLQTRDYVFVEDVVRANMAVSDSDLSGAFNVGTGVETSVVELFEAMCAALGGPYPSVHAPAKAGEQLRSVLDGAKLRLAAGLAAPNPLAHGLRQTLEWMTQQAS
ncbi:MAG: NAD-dependent epimerase/dehydratase family protein [Thermoanaerobaculia bacterium]|nr:NAD-dependent epimerase/dehydratase family protein [Thermoanaerobaculia bacterium]